MPCRMQSHVQAFTQALLDKERIEEQLLLYILEKGQKDVAVLRFPHLPSGGRSIRINLIWLMEQLR